MLFTSVDVTEMELWFPEVLDVMEGPEPGVRKTEAEPPACPEVLPVPLAFSATTVTVLGVCDGGGTTAIEVDGVGLKLTTIDSTVTVGPAVGTAAGTAAGTEGSLKGPPCCAKGLKPPESPPPGQPPPGPKPDIVVYKSGGRQCAMFPEGEKKRWLGKTSTVVVVTRG